MLSILRYLAKTCWREAGLVARIVYGTIVAFSLIASFSTAQFGWPPPESIPWWASATVALVAFLVLLIWTLGKRAYQFDEAAKTKINVNWRFDQKQVELILTNISTKTINGLDVLFRNYRKADGSNVKSVLHSLVSKDGKRTPITMNPLVPTYFSFARLVRSPEESKIWLLPDTDATVSVQAEVGVKLGISGTDIPNQNVDLRLKAQADCISIQPWDVNKKAVSDAGSGDE